MDAKQILLGVAEARQGFFSLLKQVADDPLICIVICSRESPKAVLLSARFLAQLSRRYDAITMGADQARKELSKCLNMLFYGEPRLIVVCSYRTPQAVLLSIQQFQLLDEGKTLVLADAPAA